MIFYGRCCKRLSLYFLIDSNKWVLNDRSSCMDHDGADFLKLGLSFSVMVVSTYQIKSKLFSVIFTGHKFMYLYCTVSSWHLSLEISSSQSCENNGKRRIKKSFKWFASENKQCCMLGFKNELFFHISKLLNVIYTVESQANLCSGRMCHQPCRKISE